MPDLSSTRIVVPSDQTGQAYPLTVSNPHPVYGGIVPPRQWVDSARHDPITYPGIPIADVIPLQRREPHHAPGQAAETPVQATARALRRIARQRGTQWR